MLKLYVLQRVFFSSAPFPPSVNGFMIALTENEEKVLAAELDGYTDYMKRVKYRLIPYIW